MRKKIYIVTMLFIVSTVETFAQTINFEYEATRKYPIYTVFEGDISAAWETTSWFSDEKSWHYDKNEWKWDAKTEEFYYVGPDQDDDTHWIIDKGQDFYIGPDDPNNSYAYLNNSKKDWEMFRMVLNDTTTIYATGNEVFDRISGTPSKNNPYIGVWRSRNDVALVVTFTTDTSCKMEITNNYKNTPIIAKPATAKSSNTVTPSGNTAKTSTASGGDPVRAKLVAQVKSHLGATYRTGGVGQQVFDCSGLVQHTYKEVTGIVLPRTSRDLYYSSGKQIKASELKPGDIIVYATEGGGRPSHVGMFVGDNSIVHAWGPGGDNKVVLHSRDRKSYNVPMTQKEIRYLRFLND